MDNPLAVISPANSETSLVDYCHYYCDSRCCNSIFLLPDEYETFKKNQLVEENDPTITNMGDYYILQADKKTGKCRYLKNNLCSIQSLKPIDCKVWPLYFNPKKNEPNVLNCDSNCPVVKNLPQKFINAAMKELGKVPEILRREFFEITQLLGYKLNEIVAKNEKVKQIDEQFCFENEDKNKNNTNRLSQIEVM